MTEKQKLFCLEYLKDLNATRAYKAVYKNVKKDSAARACSSQLLTKPNIKKYVDEKLEKIKSAKIADATEVLEYLTSVMRGEITEEKAMVVSIGDFESEIATKKVEVAPKDRNSAALTLSKYHKLLTENINVNQIPIINVDIPDE
jgi:phage terminase small subunit